MSEDQDICSGCRRSGGGIYFTVSRPKVFLSDLHFEGRRRTRVICSRPYKGTELHSVLVCMCEQRRALIPGQPFASVRGSRVPLIARLPEGLSGPDSRWTFLT